MGLMSAIGNLVIKMSTDESQMVRGITRAQKHMKRLDKSVSGTSGKINALVASYVGFRTIVTATNALMEGAALEREENRMNAFAGSVEKGAESLAAFNRGAGDTADRLTAVQQTSRIMQLGLAGNAQELENLVEMATRLGKQTLSVTQRVEDFTALLANQSTRRLDNFGISAAQVTNRVEELKKKFPETAKETLWLQAAIEGGMASLGKLGERSGDTLSKFEKLRAKVSDLRLEIAKGLAPVIGDLIDDMNEFQAMMDPSGRGDPDAGMTAIATNLVNFIDSVVTGLKVLYLGLQTLFQSLIGGIAGMTAILLGYVNTVLSALKDVAGFDKTTGMEVNISNLADLSGASFDAAEDSNAKMIKTIDEFARRSEKPPVAPPVAPSPVADAIVQKIDDLMQYGPSRDDLRSLIQQRGEMLTGQMAANQALIDKAEAALKQPAQIFAEAQASGGAGFLRATMGLNTQNRERQAEIARQKQQVDELKKINATLEKSLGENTERTMDIAY